MARKTLVLASMIFTAATLPASAAGNAEAGKKKAGQCQTCHGMDGMSKLPEAPHLAGQNPIYLVRTLNDYKSGARKNVGAYWIAWWVTPSPLLCPNHWARV